MGIRSTTKIYEDGKLVLALYKQYDGNLESWGKKLIEFINSKKFVNGIGADKNVFNGIGCFALQLVKAYKKEAGDLYATTEDDKEEYNYIINYDIKGTLTLTCEEDEGFKQTWNC